MNHKNIIGFYSLEIFETQLAIKMQLAEGASLSNLIESKLNSNSWFSEEEVKLIMENIWAGIEYFH